MQVFIHCQLDYCNAMLIRIADAKIKQLWSVRDCLQGFMDYFPDHFICTTQLLFLVFSYFLFLYCAVD